MLKFLKPRPKPKRPHSAEPDATELAVAEANDFSGTESIDDARPLIALCGEPEDPFPKGACDRHTDTPAEDACSDCGRSYCKGCLVWPFGQKSEPLCIGCALVAGGVRRRPKLVSKRRAKAGTR